MLFGADLAKPSLFLISIQIGLCICLYDALERKDVCNLYSILGKSTLLFRYTSWLTDTFFYTSTLHILATSFVITILLHSLLPFSEIQTLRYLLLLSPFLLELFFFFTYF